MSWLHPLRLLAVAAPLILTACVTGNVGGLAQLPDKLGDKGVLVIEGYGFDGNFEVDGDTAAFMRSTNRHMVVPLGPGDHVLNGLVKLSVADSAIPGKSAIVTTRLPMNWKFHIEAGKVTNLGLVLIVDDKKVKDRSYILAFNNLDTARRYFRATYPGLSANLNDSDFIAAPVPYQPAARIPMARRLVAFEKSLQSDWVVDPAAKQAVVAGPAGLIGEYVFKGGRPVDIKVYETNTLANAVSVTALGGRYFAAMSDGSLFLLDHGRLTPVNPPAGAGPISKAKLLPGGLVVVDARMVAYSSSDEGRHWSRFADAQMPPGKLNDYIDTASGGGRFFIYTSPEDMRLVFTDENRIAFRVMAGPEHACEGMNLYTTKSGTFVGPCPAGIGEAPVIFFQARGGSAWETRHAPTYACHLTTDPNGGTALYASCSVGNRDEKAYYLSTDDGRSWKQAAAR